VKSNNFANFVKKGSMSEDPQNSLKNKDFWNELCGSNLFNYLGLKEINMESLQVFDDYYFNTLYPYLKDYMSLDRIKDRSVMEIGLGFGSLSQYLFTHAANYVGIDYAENPVKIVNDRAAMGGDAHKAKAIRGDARFLNEIADETFDMVVSIGCLHHTGDTQKAVDEVYRVLKKNGTAVIMLYNKNSFRRLFTNPYRYFILRKTKNFFTYPEYTRGSYDANSSGEAAPIVELYSRKDLKRIFNKFKKVKVNTENFDNYYVRFIGEKRLWWQRYCRREEFLNNIAKVMGLDNYITARK